MWSKNYLKLLNLEVVIMLKDIKSKWHDDFANMELLS